MISAGAIGILVLSSVLSGMLILAGNYLYFQIFFVTFGNVMTTNTATYPTGGAVASSTTAGHPASNVVDNDTSTYWQN